MKATTKAKTLSTLFLLGMASSGFAQSPWEKSSNALMTAFTGTIAKALSLVAIVVGGLTFAFGEGAGKKTVAGIVFGVGMAAGAVQFFGWLFG